MPAPDYPLNSQFAMLIRLMISAMDNNAEFVNKSG